MNEFVFIIQARTGSTRLPKKMVRPFYEGKTIPELLILRLKETFNNIPIVLATTDSQKDDELVKIVEGTGAFVFRGDEDNVLSRFLEVQETVPAKAVVRICADNPFLDMKLLKELINNWQSNMDYLAHQIKGKPCMKTAYGFFGEITTYEALGRVEKYTDDILFKEHVTNYIYGHPELFEVNWIEAPEIIAKNEFVRLTVDTENDFLTAQKVYSSLQKDSNKLEYASVIEFVKNNNFTSSMTQENKLNAK